MQVEDMEDSVAGAEQPAEEYNINLTITKVEELALTVWALHYIIPNGSSAQPRTHCPLCNARIKAYFRNFNEKYLMCENTKCVFPYGHEPLQFFRVNNNKLPHEELTLSESEDSPTATCDNSIAALLETYASKDRLSKTFESEDQSKKDSAKKIENIQLTKHLYDITQLTKELTGGEQVPKVNIRNEKWIKNLQAMQKESGVQLLNKEEMGLLRKEEPRLSIGELKVVINPVDVKSAKKFENVQLTKHLYDITQLTKELTGDKKVPKVNIRNKKWIKKLQAMQKESGVQLLNKEEMGLLRKEEPHLGVGEPKVVINPVDVTSAIDKNVIERLG